ncbi:MAG: hypothetical protein LBH07_06170 [Treponema sp.]|jgi:hypothetical protein|nr:hypothetical protein [Treponema sp.]
MKKTAWVAFRKTLDRYRSSIDTTGAAVPDLGGIIQQLISNREGPSYTVKTPVVYNLALNDISPESEIKMILAGDNPGRREQEDCRYLVGPSGKIAEKFFLNNPELGINFRKNVLLLNKTPIHTPRTGELKDLCKLGGRQLENAVLSSQQHMAELLNEFWKAFSGKIKRPEGRRAALKQPVIPVWIIGYSEMRKGGIFETYTKTLKSLCGTDPEFKNSLFFFRHFSMNQFAIDIKRQARPGEGLAESLRRIGAAYRERILGHD